MRTYYEVGSWNVICTSCKEEKQIQEFYIHSNGKPRKQCKACVLSKRAKISVEVSRKASEKYRKTHYDLCLARSRQWRVTNLAYDAFRSSLYRARKKQQCPIWADIDKIKTIYLSCPAGHHVDHIIPLKGTHACGLHIETNLQYLLAEENLKKRNLYGW